MNDIINKEAERLYSLYINHDKKWQKKHEDISTFDKCIQKAEVNFQQQPDLIKRINANTATQDKKPNIKKSSFIFNLKDGRYNTCRAYLEKRCAALPSQIENKYRCTSCHNSSTCYGMSNYIYINADHKESFCIRISDHSPTGSCEPCDHYIYIDNRSWSDIKKEVFEVIENFFSN